MCCWGLVAAKSSSLLWVLLLLLAFGFISCLGVEEEDLLFLCRPLSITVERMNSMANYSTPSKWMYISLLSRDCTSLPEECLIEIFRRLSDQERSTGACVSKPWLNLSSTIRRTDICNPNLYNSDVDSAEEPEEDGCLSRCLEGKKATDLRLLAIAVGTANHGGLGKLSVRGSNNSSCKVTDFGLSGIARGCPSLKSLSLWNVSCVRDKGLSEIAKGCHLLEKLDLCRCPSITNECLIAIAENCPNLSSLRIESCSRIGNDGLQAIAQHCFNLEMVSIKDCPLIGDQGIGSLLSSSSSLTKLMLNGLSISDFSLAVIGHYGKSIDHLSLSNLKNVTEKGFGILGNAGRLQSLMSLAVASCLGMTDQSIEAIGKGCPALKQICLKKCHFVLDQGLVAFSKSAVSLVSLHLEEINKITLYGVILALSVCKPKLRNLSLVSCVGLKDKAAGGEIDHYSVHSEPFWECWIDHFGKNVLGLSWLTTPCRSIRSLSVINCPGFGNAGLIILGKMCPELHQLDLSGLYGVTDEGLLSILKTCEGALVKLNLNGCFNLSDIVITTAVGAHGDTIKTMNLEGCRKLTDLSLVAITEQCRLLGELYMTFCGITDFGLAVLSSAEQLNLEILSFSGCSGISDKSMESLIKMQESLVGLNLQHCNSMSSTTIELLDEKLWRCDILY